MFSDQIFEAVVVKVDYVTGLCRISPLDANLESNIKDVPLPFFAANGNAGIFLGIKPGARVLAVHTAVRGREETLIAALIPQGNLYKEVFNSQQPLDLPSGTIPYPTMAEGKLVLRGDNGAEITASELGDVLLKTVSGAGFYLKRNQTRAACTLAVQDLVQYTNAFKTFSGPVRRMSQDARAAFGNPNLTTTPLFADPNYPLRTVPLGFFLGSRPLRRTYNRRKRNPEISEYRMVINEFSSDYFFTGFDDEVERAKKNISLLQDSDTLPRNRDPGNTLHLSESELIEIIGGNVVDINGNVLDINYQPVIYGNKDRRVPDKDLELNYDRARRISRRGIGYHFQLSTNTRSNDQSSTSKNFVFDMDKEGVFKLKVPASSDTGNIPFASSANFIGEGNQVDVSSLYPSEEENIPVTLRDENGEVVYPRDAGLLQKRRTGVRYSVGDESPYFTTDGAVSSIRVNQTRYHNMYTAAERLIANTVKVVNVPKRFTDLDGFPEGLSVNKPFEVPIPESLYKAESGSGSPIESGDTDFPTFMSVIAVEPGKPAIYHGGGQESPLVGTVVAGVNYTEGNENPPYSNGFNSTISGDEVTADIADGLEEARPVGGVSAHLDFEGSIISSVGKDNFDQKSVVLDTAGSMIAWLGKDRNNRSMVMQTDGDFLLNVGGGYTNKVMNKGRFELRVNVTDKGFVTSKSSEIDASPDSDFIISISESGLVIGGMKREVPMVLRNDGPILIESTNSDVTIKGIQVKTVDPKGTPKQEAPPTRSS